MRLLFILLFVMGAGYASADESLIAAKTLIVGSEQDFPPFALGKSVETAGGFTVELWNAVAQESGIDYSLRVLPFNQLLEEFKTGKIDILINLAQSEERHHFADFTVPTVIVKGAIFVRKGETAIRSEADLAGKSIIVLNADLAHDYAIAQGWQKQLLPVETAAEGMVLLSAGKGDALLISKLVGLQTIQDLKLANIEVLTVSAGFSQKFSFAVHEGEADLLAKINEGLAIIKSTGVYGKLYDKWFAVYEEKRIYRQVLYKYFVPALFILGMMFAYLYYRWWLDRTNGLKQISAYRQRAQLALEGADLGLWDWSVPSGTVYFNERWCTMLGYQPDEIAPHVSSWEKLVHPDDWVIINPALSGHLDGKLPHYESEHRMRHKNGHWLWVLDRGKAVERDALGKALRVTGTHLDITARKQTEAQLNQLLAQQQAILDNKLIGISLVKDGTVTWVNSFFERKLGSNGNRLVGTPVIGLFADQQAFLDLMERIRCGADENLPVFRTKLTKTRRDGQPIWVDLVCTALNDDENERIGFWVDVTDQKLAEDQKQEALIRLNKIAAQLPGVIYQYCLRADGSAYFPYASERIRDIYRVSPEQAHDDAAKIFAVIHPDDYETVANSIQKSAQDLSPWQLEYRVKFPDGTVNWLYGNALPQRQEDGSVLWHGFITDITANKKAEHTLRVSQERLTIAFEGAHDGLWDWNYQTDEVYYSPRWKSMLGYADHELENKLDTWATLVDPSDRDRVYQQAQDYAQGKIPKFETEFRMRHKDGHWVEILSRATLFSGMDGKKPIGTRLIGTHVDMTVRKQEHQQRLENEKALRLILVREVHHRIKNNLQGITGILRRYSVNYPDLQRPINQAISQLQSIAVIYGLQGQDSVSDVNVCDLLEAIAKGHEQLWKVSFKFDKPPEWPHYCLSGRESVPIALILNELILNAVKYGKNTGYIKISLRMCYSKQGIQIAIYNNGQLPTDFNFNSKQHLNTGLHLVASLLPSEGAALTFTQQGSLVVVTLELNSPVLAKTYDE